MFRTTLFLLACLLACCAQVCAITLVKDGKPAATIIISEAAYNAKPYARTAGVSPKADEKIRAAANDLQTYIKKISGAELPILSDAMKINLIGEPVILIGESNQTKLLKLKYPTGVTKDFREEGFTINCNGDTLALVGNDAGPYHGSEYAVNELLYRLGCRWYMPTEYGEYLPGMKTITVPKMNFIDTPDFAQRLWWQNATAEMQAADAEFKIHNKMNCSQVFQVAGDGSIRSWVPDAKLVETKPELFGKNPDGSVNQYMVNLTNPEAAAIVAEKMKADIKQQIEKGVAFPQVAIAPDDGMPIDYTKETMAGNLGFTDLGGRQIDPTQVSVSDEWFRFVNKVTEEVTKEYPNALIATNGYSNRNQLPKGVALDPNLTIEFAAIWADVLHPYNSPRSWQARAKGEMLKHWSQANNRVYLYDYDMQMLVTAVTPVPQVHNLRVNMPLLKQWGLAGFLDEARNAYMEEGVQSKYLRARMMWDADLNVDAVVNDYFSHWYGAAAKPSKAFWDALEECQDQSPLLGHEDRVLPFVYTPQLLKTLEKFQTQAETVVDDKRSQLHVHVDRVILEHLKHYMAMHDAEFNADYAKAANEAESMLACRRELEEITPFYVRTKADLYFLNSGEMYWGATHRKAHYLKLADLLNGKTGALVAMAPRQAKVALDPADAGHVSGWYDTGFDRKAWKAIDTCKPFYLQMPGALTSDNIPYQGYLWYNFELDVPASAKDKPLTLYSPIVVDDAWVWVNGQFVGHRGRIDPYMRPAPIEYDVTKLIKPGAQNTVTVRVGTGFCPAAVADGFLGRLFLYSPVAK